MGVKRTKKAVGLRLDRVCIEILPKLQEEFGLNRTDVIELAIVFFHVYHPAVGVFSNMLYQRAKEVGERVAIQQKGEIYAEFQAFLEQRRANKTVYPPQKSKEKQGVETDE